MLRPYWGRRTPMTGCIPHPLEIERSQESVGTGGGAVEPPAAVPPPENLNAPQRAIFESVGPDVYAIWFEDCTITDSSGLRIEAPTEFHAQYLRGHFTQELSAIAGPSGWVVECKAAP